MNRKTFSYYFSTFVICLSGLNADITPKIVDGKDADPDEWPYMVAIARSGDDIFVDYFAGGSLIHPRYVLTAAHVFIDEFASGVIQPSSVNVVIGGSDLLSLDESRIPVAEVIIHPEYNEGSTDFDIALLVLREPVHDVPLLPLTGSLRNEEPGVEALALGYGSTSRNVDNPNISFTLQEGFPLPVMDFDEANGPAEWNGALTTNMLAAGPTEFGVDVCIGDDGGPLLAQNARGQWVQIGVTSLTRAGGCGIGEEVSVFTRVWSLRDWILSHISPAYLAFEEAHGIFGHGEDPDGDGLPNLLEHILGGDPGVPEFSMQPQFGIRVVNETEYSTFTYDSVDGNSEFLSFVEESTDLISWVTLDREIYEIESEDLGEGMRRSVTRSTSPIGDSQANFMRINTMSTGSLPPFIREIFPTDRLWSTLMDGDPHDPVRSDTNVYFSKDYRLSNLEAIPDGKDIRVELRSTGAELDPFLQVVEEGDVIRSEDGGIGDDLFGGAAIEFSPDPAKENIIRVSSASPGEVGEFEIVTKLITPPILVNISDATLTANGGFVFLPGQTLSETDDFDPNRGNHYKKDYLLQNAAVGRQISITMADGTGFLDTYLQLINADTGEVLTFNDDGGFRSSRLFFTVEAGKTYIVRASSFATFETGNYTLTFLRIDPGF